MMHYNDIVVSICDSNKKSLREYDSQRLSNGRKSNIHIPFDSEYQIMVKNNQGKRIKLDIDIDGSNITNDGFVIHGFQTAYLERFLNTNKKFKFVPVTNDGVADPTSSDNGIITVKVNFEYTPYNPILRSAPRRISDWGDNTVYGSSYSATLSAPSSMVGSITSCSYSLNSVPTMSGATVEGSQSNQKFSETTWGGNDSLLSEIVFKFKLLGMNSQDSKEWQDYLRLKQKFEAA
jgi:hypothetical protein